MFKLRKKANEKGEAGFDLATAMKTPEAMKQGREEAAEKVAEYDVAIASLQEKLDAAVASRNYWLDIKAKLTQ